MYQLNVSSLLGINTEKEDQKHYDRFIDSLKSVLSVLGEYQVCELKNPIVRKGLGEFSYITIKKLGSTSLGDIILYGAFQEESAAEAYIRYLYSRKS